MIASRFGVSWPRKFFQRHRREGIWLLQCTVLERRLSTMTGKPEMVEMAKLSSIDEDKTMDVSAADQFWHDVSRKLGRMIKLSLNDIDVIEALIAQRVPKPLPQAVEVGKVALQT